MKFEFLGLVVYLAVLFFQPGQFFPIIESLRPALLVVGITLSFALFRHFTSSTAKIPGSRINTLLILFFLWQVLSIVKSIAVNRSYTYLMEYVKVLSLYLLTLLAVNTEVLVKKLLWVLIAFTTIICTVNIYAHHKGLFSGRMTSFFGGMKDSNGFGLFLVMMIPYIAAFLLEARLDSRKAMCFYIYSLFASLYCITRTYSRGAFLALFVVFGLIGLRNRKEAKIVSLMFILIVIVTTYKTPPKYWNRINTITKDNIEIDSGAKMSRIIAWTKAVEMIKEEPFLGVGLGNFEPRWSSMHTSYNEDGRTYVCHNTFLEIAAESGLIALFLFLMVIQKTYSNCKYSINSFKSSLEKQTQKNKYIAEALQISLIGFCVGGFFTSEQACRLLYILIALSVFMKHQADSNILEAK